jgi:PPOX class probable F420-dependent enzyme
MRARLAGARVARLATTGRDGRPHLVPCCFAIEGDTAYSAVDGKPKSTRSLQRLANLEAEPRAALLVDHYEDDWERLWWVRVDATARVLLGGAEFERSLVLLAGKYEQYQRDPPAGPVIALDILGWRGWP